MLLNEPFPKNSSLADIMEKAPKMFVMPRASIVDLRFFHFIEVYLCIKKAIWG